MSREMAVERMWLFGKAFCIYDDTPGYNPPFRSMCTQSTRYFLFKTNIAQNKSRLVKNDKSARLPLLDSQVVLVLWLLIFRTPCLADTMLESREARLVWNLGLQVIGSRFETNVTSC